MNIDFLSNQWYDGFISNYLLLDKIYLGQSYEFLSELSFNTEKTT